MKKNLVWKFALIAALTVLALIQIYPPDKKLKPGLDLAGGTSLIYEIDASGLTSTEARGLSDKMITVLKRRVDPDGVRNLVWRPLGSTRFEIQMPLASVEARQKRQKYEDALNKALAGNINIAKVLRSLSRPPAERQGDFAEYAGSSETAKRILSELSDTYDQLQTARLEADSFEQKLKEKAEQIEKTDINIDSVETSVGYWIAVNGNDRTAMIEAFLGDDNTESNRQLLQAYTEQYQAWSDAMDVITNPEDGKNVAYQKAQNELKNLILTEEELKNIFDLSDKKRTQEIKILKDRFPDPERAEAIDEVAAAFEGYRQFRGRLDDPKDLQRMLKGAGILEFRILPTRGQENSDTQLLDTYLDNLRTKGPKFASDDKYVWCQLEDADSWFEINQAGQLDLKSGRDKDHRPCVVGEFGGRNYVLCSNKKSEVMLHSADEKSWKLQSSYPTQDQYGRMAIGFSLDTKGANMFGQLTGKNLGRPLCILLDELAISAPYISSRITDHGIIQGDFTNDERANMVDKLNAGSLPAMLIEQPISVKTIGPSIGADNRDAGIKAGIIGLILVVAFMLVYYLAAGGVADFALLFNMLVILAVMAALRATFTLPGIAGLILTIGMSVDANVLIFERIREEQLKGSSLRIAVKNGYQKTFSAILDANITTFITAAILYWIAPEEVKGFAIVLMIGIISSVFAALFVTRAFLDWFGDLGLMKDRIVMLQIIKNPNINWMALRPVFMFISIALIAGGLFVFFTRDDAKNNKYDIEFTGGTAVTINLAEPMHIQKVRDRISQVGRELGNPAITAANVYSIGEEVEKEVYSRFEVNMTETNKTVTELKLAQAGMTADKVKAEIIRAQDKLGKNLSNLIITADSQSQGVYKISTSQLNKSVVKQVLSEAFADAQISEPVIDEVVNNAILEAFGEQLEVRQNLAPEIVSTNKITEQITQQYPELLDYLGGIRIICKTQKNFTGADINKRFNDLHFKPEMENADWYDSSLMTEGLKLLQDNEKYTSFIYVSIIPEAGSRQLTDDEWRLFEQAEIEKVTMAAELEESLPRVTQVNPSIGSEAKTRAQIAIALSLFAIIAYIWVRFGDARYGFAAIAALVHDVCISLGAVTACTYIASTAFGRAMLIEDFKISQVIIAAFLTLIGYSLNDTIVIFDRIRENRKKAQLLPQTINSSINQTMSRTIITSLTTFIVVLIMYIFGGQNLRGFTFAIGFGIIIGTYSSVAIAAPLLLLGKKGKGKADSRK
ncbi:MAG: protein translocase subunit SecD [Sedimentisphaerales bacterium]|nr:protein translocase subunit SecD [Sedimentisphaerales bacterium]